MNGDYKEDDFTTGPKPKLAEVITLADRRSPPQEEPLSGPVRAYQAALCTEMDRQREQSKHHTIGAKYVQGRDVAEVARLLRADIAEAIRMSELPKGLKCSVRIARYAGGQSLNLEVTALPAELALANPARVLFDKTHPHRPHPAGMGLYSDEATQLVAKLEKLANAYNYDRSDSMTDYWDVNFYLHVEFSFAVRQATK